MPTPTPKQIAAYARREARRVLSVRRVDPVLAAQIATDAAAECARMAAAAGLAH